MQQARTKEEQNWVGKMILWELCKKLKFDHTTKDYKHIKESVNEMPQILLNSEI